MKRFLTSEQRRALKAQHKIERDSVICDRIKVILSVDNGVPFSKIAEILLIDEDTARRHLKQFQDEGSLSLKSGGSEGLLIGVDALNFMEKLESSEVPTAECAVHLAYEMFNIHFSTSGMTAWLKRNGFSWKKSVGTPAKANSQDQATFIKAYTDLKNTLPEGDVILFMDASHPTMTTKLGYGWSRKGERKVVATTGAKKRVNVLASLDLHTLKLTPCFPEQVNTSSLQKHFQQLRKTYPIRKHQILHIVLDQGPYNRCEETRAAALKYGIRSVFYLHTALT